MHLAPSSVARRHLQGTLRVTDLHQQRNIQRGNNAATLVNRLQVLVGSGQQQATRGAPLLLQKARHRFIHLLHPHRSRQLARKPVQAPRHALAARRLTGLGAQPGGELADDQRDHEHHGKSEQVRGVADLEGEARRHEQKIEQGHTQHRRQDRRPTPGHQGHHHHGQQEEHHRVGQIEMGAERQQARHHHPAGQHRQPIAPARGALAVFSQQDGRQHGDSRRGRPGKGSREIVAPLP